MSDVGQQSRGLGWVAGRIPDPDVEPTAPARPSRWLADQSGDGRVGPEPRFALEACRVFDRLKELGGRGRLGEVYVAFNGVLRGFVRDGIADLERLGLVSWQAARIPGQEALLVLSPGWEKLGLTSAWSRAGW